MQCFNNAYSMLTEFGMRGLKEENTEIIKFTAALYSSIWERTRAITAVFSPVFTSEGGGIVSLVEHRTLREFQQREVEVTHGYCQFRLERRVVARLIWFWFTLLCSHVVHQRPASLFLPALVVCFVFHNPIIQKSWIVISVPYDLVAFLLSMLKFAFFILDYCLWLKVLHFSDA